MKMTKEEAIAILQEEYDYCKSGYDLEADPEEECLETTKYLRALHVAISALRPIIREQVEKARWIKIYEDGEPAIEQHQIGVACSKCMNMPKDRFTESKFCPNCGRPMTDEAVDMVMERLNKMEEMKK